jgi:hypothetical protein
VIDFGRIRKGFGWLVSLRVLDAQEHAILLGSAMEAKDTMQRHRMQHRVDARCHDPRDLFN